MKLLVFACNWCSSTAADLAGTSRLEMPADFTIVRVLCSGRVDPVHILRALVLGADGVLVTGCHPGDCHYTSGNYYARRRFAMFRKLLDYMGVDLRRVKFSWVSAAEGAKWAHIIDEFTEEVRALGPYESFRAMCTS